MTVRENLKVYLKSRKFIFLAATMVFVAVLPFLVQSDYVLGEVLTPMLIFAIYASSWNLLASSGQGSLGHAAFLGIGGFSSALIALRLGLPPLVGLIVGGLFSAAVGFLIGLTCIRLKAWFLAMVTFGFSVIIVTIFTQFDNIFMGILGFPAPLIAPRGISFYYLSLVVAVISIVSMFWIMKSKTGLAFRATHQNELEAKMIGINTGKYRLIAFVISTFFAGIAGGLFAQSIRYIDISIFDPYYSFLPLMMAVIGGLGTIEGPIIGSIIIVTIDSYLPRIDPFLNSVAGSIFPAVSNVGPPIRFLALGVFLVLVVIFFPKGITSLIQKGYALIQRFLSKRGLNV